MDALTLMLADGRWPGGGYAHSGGLEAAVEDGTVHDPTTLGRFAEGRLATVGLTEAWLAAAAAAVLTPVAAGTSLAHHPGLLGLEQECDARTPAAPLRQAGRTLGRGLRRSAGRCWPVAGTLTVEQYPVVLGAVAAVAGLGPAEAARLAVHHALFGPLNAAPKLLPIDMADVCAVAVRAAPVAEAVVAEALDALATDHPPAWSAPLLEWRAEAHARWEVRLFAS